MQFKLRTDNDTTNNALTMFFKRFLHLEVYGEINHYMILRNQL
jgi:hypothetical protein